MSLILSHTTALEFWISLYAISDYALRNPSRSNLLHGSEAPLAPFDPILADLCAPATLETVADASGATSIYAPPVTLRRSRTGTTRAPDFETARRYFERRNSLHSPPYHLLVLSEINYRRRPEFKVHSCTASLPTRSFFLLKDGAYAVSPELCFAQMASMLDRIELIELGFRFCGQYATTKDYPGFAFRHPVSDSAFLTKQLKRMRGINGARKALSVAKYICNGSASPRETHLTMILSLPCSWGGYGLPKPLLNHRIESIETTDPFNVHYRLCDLYWPEGKIAVEYDSDAFHTGAERIAKDAQRRNALALHGIEVVTVTNKQLKSTQEMDKVALLIARRLGIRLRFDKRYDYRTRQLQLKEQLLYSGLAPTLRAEQLRGLAPHSLP